MNASSILSLGLLLMIPTLPMNAATLIVANKSDDTVDLIDTRTGKSTATIPTGHAPHEVETSPDGTIAVVADYGDRSTPGSTLTVIDLRSKEVVRTIDLGEHQRPHGLSWLEGSEIAVTTEGSRDLVIVDVDSGEIVASIPTGQQVSHMVAVTPDKTRAFVANIGSGTVTVIDLVEREKIRDIETGAGAEGIAVTPDGREVWVTNRDADTISIIDTETLEILDTVECSGFPIRVEIMPDGNHALVSAARSGEVVRFDTKRRREIAREKLDLSTVSDDAKRLFADFDSPVPVGIQINTKGDRAWVAATQSDAVVVIDPVTVEVLDVIRAGREPDGMAWAE
jgi:YVTN family beta-propeller protein